jgi:hypothetical protein
MNMYLRREGAAHNRALMTLRLACVYCPLAPSAGAQHMLHPNRVTSLRNIKGRVIKGIKYNKHKFINAYVYWIQKASVTQVVHFC